jgi:hypothetical protein
MVVKEETAVVAKGEFEVAGAEEEITKEKCKALEAKIAGTQHRQPRGSCCKKAVARINSIKNISAHAANARGDQPRTSALQFPSCPLDAALTLRDGAHSMGTPGTSKPLPASGISLDQALWL